MWHTVPQAFLKPNYSNSPRHPNQQYVPQFYSYYAGRYLPVYPPYYVNEQYSPRYRTAIMDYGQQPYVVNLAQVTKENSTYRTAIWTGKHFQVTVMSIPVGEDIGLEIHPDTDQLIRIEEGQGLVQMGDSSDKLNFEAAAYADYAMLIPAGKWHNVTNTGSIPLKVSIIYAPPEHPFGTVQATNAEAMMAHGLR